MSNPRRWDDLAPRVASGIAIALVGIAALWFGDPWLSLLSTLTGGLMLWETSRITAPDRPRDAVILGVIASVVLAYVFYKHNPFWLALLILPALLGAFFPRRDRWGFVLTAVAIMLTSYAIVGFRGGYGAGFVLWLVMLVVAVDTLGYFGGRIIGGPKFWPRVSPKKTWSGTIAGWCGAALVGAAAWMWGGAPLWIVPFSALVGFAGQMGDIGESALKRRAGVKDASNLIPGHGGLMDRFDGLSGAILFILIWGLALPVPPVGG